MVCVCVNNCTPKNAKASKAKSTINLYLKNIVSCTHAIFNTSFQYSYESFGIISHHYEQDFNGFCNDLIIYEGCGNQCLI